MTTKAEKRKKVFTIIVLILLIMAMSFGFRFLVNRRVIDHLGEYYVDPGTGVPYLTEMDSYYHLRMTRDIDYFGHAGDTFDEEGNPWDSLSYAPTGRSADGYRPLMSYIALAGQAVTNLFDEVTLEQIAYWQAPVVSALVVIPVFLLVYHIQGLLGAIVASVLAAINYGYFLHTVPGFFDTDMVISWTSCLLMFFGCLLIESLGKFTDEELNDVKRKDNITRCLICGTLFVLSLLLLIASWDIYYMFVVILVLAAVIYILMRIILTEKSKRKIKAKGFAPLFGFVITMSALILILNPGLIGNAFGTIRAVFGSSEISLFPNTYVSVSELRKPALIAGGFSGLFQMKVLSGSNIGVINAVGGLIPCLAALTSIGLFIRDFLRKKVRFEQILLILWFIITAVLAVRSWRFIMLFAFPVAILSGIFTGWICGLMNERKMMDWKIFAGMIMALMLFPAVYGAFRSSGDSAPSVNQPLHESLNYIRETEPEDTVLTSWWDYGYFYEEKAERPTLFDGGSQDGKRVYWVSRALGASDENLAGNIFNMLATTGDAATVRMLDVFGENKETLDLMEELLSGDRASCGSYLLGLDIPSDDAHDLTDLLFPEQPRRSLFIMTQDMANISGWFAKFGYSDDDRYAENNYSVVMDHVELTSVNGKSAYQFSSDDQTVNFYIEEENGEYKAYTKASESDDSSQPCPIEKVIVIEDGNVTELSMDLDIKEGSGYTVIINSEYDRKYVSLTTSLFAGSVFGRMYYLNGDGMEHFVLDDAVPGSARIFEVN